MLTVPGNLVTTRTCPGITSLVRQRLPDAVPAQATGPESNDRHFPLMSRNRFFSFFHFRSEHAPKVRVWVVWLY